MSIDRILCAAILVQDRIKHVHQPKNVFEGYVICGRRHHNCIMTANILGVSTKNQTQGFLTEQDFFVTRFEASKIAFEAGQIKEWKEGQQLFSEDLY